MGKVTVAITPLNGNTTYKYGQQSSISIILQNWLDIKATRSVLMAMYFHTQNNARYHGDRWKIFPINFNVPSSSCVNPIKVNGVVPEIYLALI